MKRSQVILGFSALVLMLAGLSFWTYRSKDEASFFPLKDFVVKSTETREVSGLSVTDIEAENNDALLRLELVRGMNEKLASLYLEEKEVGIESLFLTQPAHYPGAITREVECPAQFHPEKGDIRGMAYYIMYANERFFYGVCAQELVKYRSIMGLRYCKEQKTFVEAKLFFPPEIFNKDRALELLGSFQCS